MNLGNWLSFFVIGWGTTFTAYVILQVMTLVNLKRYYAYAAAVPLPFMAWVAFATVEAFLQGSNMWPILMILASPCAVLFLLVVAAMGLNVQGHARRGQIVASMLAIAVAASGPYVYMFIAAG